MGGDPSQQRPRLREPAPRRLRVRAANEASALHPRPQVRPRPGGDEAREVDEAPGAAGRRPVEEEADPAPPDLRGILRRRRHAAVPPVPQPQPNGRPLGAIPPARPAHGRDADADAGRIRCQRRADQDQDEEPSVPAVRGCRPGPVRTSNAPCAAEGPALDAAGSRRATRPFVPQADPAFNDLQRQVQLLETLPAAPIRPTRVNIDELLSTDSLPAPTKRGDAPKKEEAAPAPAAPKQRQVGIADQIAIRSYVLGKGLKSSMAE